MKMNVNMPAFCMANISTNEDNISTRGYWGYFSMIIRSKFPRRSPVKTCSKRSTTEGRGLAREETENTIISNVNNSATKADEKKQNPAQHECGYISRPLFAVVDGPTSVSR